MKKFIVGLVLAAMLALTFTLSAIGSASATSDTEKKVVICHAAGQDTTTHYITLEISENAVYGRNGNAGHFEENGTTKAGHEQDYFGPCVVSTPTPTETVTPTPTPTETVVVTPTPTETVVVTPTPTVEVTTPVATPTETPVAVAPPVKTEKPKVKPTHPVTPVTPAVTHRQNLAHTGAADTTLLGGLGLGLIAGGIALYRKFAPTA